VSGKRRGTKVAGFPDCWVCRRRVSKVRAWFPQIFPSSGESKSKVLSEKGKGRWLGRQRWGADGGGVLISSPPLQARAGSCPRKRLVPGGPGQWSPRSLALGPRWGDGVPESRQHWSSARAGAVPQPALRWRGLDARCQGCAHPGAAGTGLPTRRPRFLQPEVAIGSAAPARAPYLRCPAATGTCGHALLPDPATRALHWPSARRSRHGAPTPQPWAPGRSSRVARPEGGGIRRPAGSEREPPTGAGDLREPGGARRGAGEPESPGRPLKPAGPRWPVVVRGSRVSVPTLAAAVSNVRQVPVRGAHRGHTASRPSVPQSRSCHRIPKFPQVQRADWPGTRCRLGSGPSPSWSAPARTLRPSWVTVDDSAATAISVPCPCHRAPAPALQTQAGHEALERERRGAHLARRGAGASAGSDAPALRRAAGGGGGPVRAPGPEDALRGSASAPKPRPVSTPGHWALTAATGGRANGQSPGSPRKMTPLPTSPRALGPGLRPRSLPSHSHLVGLRFSLHRFLPPLQVKPEPH
jgi:hypothetical protein